MNPTNSQQLPLRDVHLPTEPGFWPLAPGWWVLAAIVLVLLLGFVIWWHRYRQRQKKWQQMRQLLLTIQQDYQTHGHETQLVRDVSNLLRRFTRHELNKPQAASLLGQPWIDFLNRDLSEPVFDELSSALNTDLYQQQLHLSSEALFRAAHQFLRHHCLHPNRGGHD